MPNSGIHFPENPDSDAMGLQSLHTDPANIADKEAAVLIHIACCNEFVHQQRKRLVLYVAHCQLAQALEPQIDKALQSVIAPSQGMDSTALRLQKIGQHEVLRILDAAGAASGTLKVSERSHLAGTPSPLALAGGAGPAGAAAAPGSVGGVGSAARVAGGGAAAAAGSAVKEAKSLPAKPALMYYQVWAGVWP